MPTKSSDRLAEIRARVVRRATSDSPLPAEDAAARSADDAALAAASAHFLGVAEQIVQRRVVERIPVGHIAPDLRPEMRQARLLPPPDELLIHGEPTPAYREMVAELFALGQSLKEQ